jgi:ribosomal-protein-alanine N-acetyltransferase
MEIITKRLILKEIDWDDLGDIHRLHSLPEVDEYNTLGIPGELAETKELIRKDIEKKADSLQSSYSWRIALQNPDDLIGLAGMTLSNDKYRLGEIYYKLFPDYWGRGYATEVAQNLIMVGFDRFNLHKVEAGVACENGRSIQVLEKAGMTREGLRRKILPIRGEWKDCFHYAIVEDDNRDY